MNSAALGSQFHLRSLSILTTPPTTKPFQSISYLKPPSPSSSTSPTAAAANATKPRSSKSPAFFNIENIILEKQEDPEEGVSPVLWNGRVTPKSVMMGAFAVGVLMFMMDDHKALALGPEGPLMEEFWENVRRYGLYFLTVSSGAVYTVFQPILELLKNPISAILILMVMGGSIYIVSQVLSAMVGVSDFSYEYAY